MSEISADASMTLTMRAKDEAGSVVDRLAGSLNGFRTAVGAAGLAAAGAFMKATEDTVQYAKAIEKTAVLTGITSQQASALAAGFQVAGIGADQSAQMMQRLEMRLGRLDAAGQTVKKSAMPNAFKELGLSLKDAHGNAIPMTEIMPQIIDRLNGVSDPAKRALLASQLFGRGYGELIPLLARGGQGFRDAMLDAQRFGLVLSEENIVAMQKYEAANNRMKESIKGMTIQLGIVAMPVLTAFFTALTNLAVAINSIPQPIKNFAIHGLGMVAIFGSLLGGAAALTKGIHLFGQAIPIVGEHFERMAIQMDRFLGPIGLAITLGFAVYEAYQKVAFVHVLLLPLVTALTNAWARIHDIFSTFVSLVQKGVNPLIAIQAALGDTGGVIRALSGPLVTVTNDWFKLQQAWQFLNDSAAKIGPLNALLGALGILGVSTGPIADKIKLVEGAFKHFKDALASTKDPVTAASVALHDLGVPWGVLTGIIGKLNPYIAEAKQLFATIQGIIVDQIGTWKAFHDPLFNVQRLWLDLGGSGAQFRLIVATLKLAFDELMKALQGLVTAVLPALQKAWKDLTPVIGQVMSALQQMAPVVAIIIAILAVTLYAAIMLVIKVLTVALPIAINVAVQIIHVLADILSMLPIVFMGVVAIVDDLIHGRWGKAWADAMGMVGKLAPFFLDLVGRIGTIILVGLTAAVNLGVYALGQATNGFAGAIQGGILAVARAIQSAYDTVMGFVSGFASAGGAIASALWNGIVRGLAGLGNALRGAIATAKASLPGPAQDALSAIGLASGAVIKANPGVGVLARVGEGAEDEVVAKSSQLMQAGARMAGAGLAGGGGVIPITLLLDSRVLAKVMLQRSGDRWRLLGGTTGSSA